MSHYLSLLLFLPLGLTGTGVAAAAAAVVAAADAWGAGVAAGVAGVVVEEVHPAAIIAIQARKSRMTMDREGYIEYTMRRG